MNVTRVQDATGDHIEPPLDEGWDDFTKLRWHAAVVAHDTGLTVDVQEGALRDDSGNPAPGWYSIGVGRSSAAPFDLHAAWTYLNGVGTGYQQAAKSDAALTRVRGLPDRPQIGNPNRPYSGDYLLGYRMAISTAKSVASNERVVIKDAEPDAVCSVCGDEHAPYRDHRKQPFCAACVNCTCRKTVCVRTTAPPTTPAAATGDE